jgi:hypothetical protein
VPRVGVGQQHGVRQALAEHVGVSNWNHVVEHSIHDQAWLSYFVELAKALAIRLLPSAKSRDLGPCDVCAGYGLTILRLADMEFFSPCPPSELRRCGRNRPKNRSPHAIDKVEVQRELAPGGHECPPAVQRVLP